MDVSGALILADLLAEKVRRHPDRTCVVFEDARGGVRALGIPWTILRPPGVYGPHDREFLRLFRIAALRLFMLPPSVSRL